MRFFTYSRKSVFRDNSDSVANQARMCREYCESHFQNEIDSWAEYCDEDYSGATTDRPDYQRMMSDIGQDLCDILVVYQLDRFSRSVRDFSAAYEFLQLHHVRFICLDMNIDTSTPIGEAMMYVSAAFGQMERKNIAARVSDNLLGLAQNGFWTGGTTPFGYTAAKIIVDGKKHSTLVPDLEDAEALNYLFDLYISGMAFDKMKKHLNNEGFTTKSGRRIQEYFGRYMRDPTPCQATKEVRDYLISTGCVIDDDPSKWDGSHGVMVYAKKKEGKKQETRDRKEWIVAVGHHEPIVSADKWLEAQKVCESHQKIYESKYPPNLLQGILKCKCGYAMRRHRQKRAHGIECYYGCRGRKLYGNCDMKYTPCDLLDSEVEKIFKEITLDDKAILKYIDTPSNKPVSTSKLDKTIKSTQNELKRLSASLSLAEDTSAMKYIIKEIENKDAHLKDLTARRDRIAAENRKNKEKLTDIDEKLRLLREEISDFNNFSDWEKNDIAKKVIKSAVWDGTTLRISL